MALAGIASPYTGRVSTSLPPGPSTPQGGAAAMLDGGGGAAKSAPAQGMALAWRSGQRDLGAES